MKLLFALLAVASVANASAQRASVSLGSKVLDKNNPSQKKKSSFFASAAEVDLSDGSSEEDTISEDDDDPLLSENCEIGFEGIKILLKQKGKKPDRIILDGSLKGVAKPGRMLAVMGPSGSGKSSLAHALAGRIKESSKLSVEGKRYVNNVPLSGDSSLPAAVIEQDVSFFPHMTVKETLDFRVELKLGSRLGKSARDDIVSELVDLLGLTKSMDTIVGNGKVRGLSGGERKRLSIACELISSPPVLILDEPTSGLDSYQAAQVTKFLRKLADSGKTIITVIHQPSQSVFSQFDDLLLVSEGRLMYYGEISQVRSYMQNLGYPCSKDTGTAEYVLDCISRTNGGPEQQAICDERIENIAEAAKKSVQSISFDSEAAAVTHQHHHKLKLKGKRNLPGVNIFRQFKLLLTRAFNETIRGKASIIIKIVQQVTLGLVYGGIYKVGNDQASVNDRFGLLFLIVTGGLNMAIATTIRSFTREKVIISNEMSNGLYGTLPYFLAKAVSEIPLVGVFNLIFGSLIYPLANLQKGRFKEFLGMTTLHVLCAEAVGLIVGAVSPTTDVALSFFPLIIVLNIIFDGRNLSEENTPKLLRWIPKISVAKWGFQGLAITEFTGLEFDTSGPRRGPLVKTGKDALDNYGFGETSLMDVVKAQRNIIAGCWTISYIALSMAASKFEVMAS